MRHVGYYFLFTLVYCACFIALFFVSVFIIGLLVNVEWLYRILYRFSDAAPEYVLFFISSIISMLPIYHLADRLEAHGSALAFGIVTLVVNVVLLILAIVNSGAPSLYAAQIFSAIAIIVQERRKM